MNEVPGVDQRGKWRILLFFLAIAVVKFIFAGFSIANFWAMWQEEDIARLHYYDDWAAHPFILISHATWLPLPAFLFGSVFMVFGHPYTMATLLQTLISVLGGWFVFQLTRESFDERAAFIAALVFFIPVVSVRLGAGALSEPMLYAAMMFTLRYYIRFLRERRFGALIWFCTGMAVCQLIRYEGWVFSFLLSGFLIISMLCRRSEFQHKKAIPLLLVALFAIPVVWSILYYFVTGNPFQYMNNVYGCYVANWGTGVAPEKWPELFRIFFLIHPIVIAVTLMSFFFVKFRQTRLVWLFLFLAVFYFAGYLAADALNISSWFYPERFMFIPYLFLCSLAGHAVSLMLGASSRLRAAGYAALIVICVWSIPGYFDMRSFIRENYSLDAAFELKNLVSEEEETGRGISRAEHPSIFLDCSVGTFDLTMYNVFVGRQYLDYGIADTFDLDSLLPSNGTIHMFLVNEVSKSIQETIEARGDMFSMTRLDPEWRLYIYTPRASSGDVTSPNS